MGRATVHLDHAAVQEMLTIQAADVVDAIAHDIADLADPEVRAQRARLAPRLPQLDRGRQREQHALGRERLLEEGERAELGGAHRVAQARAPAHHHHGQVGEPRAQLR